MADKVDDATELVMGNLWFAEDEPKEFGPIMIAVIQTVIGLLIQYCVNKKLNPATAKKPSLLQRVVLKGYIKQSCKSREFYRKHKDRIYEAILKTGANATPEQLAKIFEGSKS